MHRVLLGGGGSVAEAPGPAHDRAVVVLALVAEGAGEVDCSARRSPPGAARGWTAAAAAVAALGVGRWWTLVSAAPSSSVTRSRTSYRAPARRTSAPDSVGWRWLHPPKSHCQLTTLPSPSLLRSTNVHLGPGSRPRTRPPGARCGRRWRWRWRAGAGASASAVRVCCRPRPRRRPSP